MVGFDGFVDGWVAAPGVGGVDDVVVDEGAGLDQFECGEGAQCCGVIFLRDVSCVFEARVGRPGKLWADAFAAVGSELCEQVDGVGDVG